MKILFFSPVRINTANKDIKGTGNWVNSLIDAMIDYQPDIELVVAYHEDAIIQIEYSLSGNLSIAKIPSKKKTSKIGKLVDKWLLRDVYKDSVNDYIKIVNRFQPDVIQLFGIEHPYIRILGKTELPIAIHLQGLLGPCLFKSYQRFSSWEFITKSGFINLLKGNVPFLSKKKIRNHLKTEELIYDKCRYFIGRTNWDRLFTQAVAPKSEYFNSQEILRNGFYKHQWQQPNNEIFRILTTSTDGPYKNIDIIFEAIKLLGKFNKDFRFEWVIIGASNTDISVNIMKRRGYSFNNLVFTGRLNSDGIIQEMLESNIFVYPSAIDNSPNALQEAMLIGMPIISSNAGGIPSLIDHNITGYLVPEGEPYSMAGAIIHFFKNQKKIEVMGKKAREVAISRNDPQKIVNSLLETSKTIIKLHLDYQKAF